MGNPVSIGDLVAVSWLDSHHIGQSWMERKEAIEECRDMSLFCKTFGQLILATEDRIAVAQSVSDGCVDNIMIIPRVAVIRIEQL